MNFVNHKMDISNITKDQNNPVAMYIVVRESLGMSPGKIAAQVGHAVELLTKNKQSLLNNDRLLNYDEYIDYYQYINDYGYRKIVLKADDKEWEKIKAIKATKAIVNDAGLTEIPIGTETVIAFWPMRKSDAQKTILKRLQLLK